MTANQRLISKIIENWAKAVGAKDIDGIMAHHALDILLFDVPEPFQSKGFDAYQLSWQKQFFPWYGDDGQFDLTEFNITAGEDVAFCTGIINCSGNGSGQKLHLTVRLTVGLEKINGEWIITHEHHSEAAK